jgi:hypothetical protein
MEVPSKVLGKDAQVSYLPNGYGEHLDPKLVSPWVLFPVGWFGILTLFRSSGARMSPNFRL